jgi:hypothetical protein
MEIPIDAPAGTSRPAPLSVAPDNRSSPCPGAQKSHKQASEFHALAVQLLEEVGKSLD